MFKGLMLGAGATIVGIAVYDYSKGASFISSLPAGFAQTAAPYVMGGLAGAIAGMLIHKVA